MLAVACCVAAMLCFSGVPVVLRSLKGFLDHWTVNAVRYSTAALFWMPAIILLSRRSRKTAHATPMRNVWIAAIIPAICNLCGQIGWAVIPYHAEASTIGFGIRTAFVFTVLLGFVFIPSERPLMRRPMFAIAIIVSIAGFLCMYLGTPQNNTGQGTTPLGMIMIIVTAFFWGTYAVSVRKFMAGFPFRLAFGVVSLYTAVVLVVLMLIFGSYGKLMSLPVAQWALLVVSALVAIALAHVLLYRGIAVVGPVVTTGIGLAGPFFTLLAAWFYLGEEMTSLQFSGGLAVVLGGAGLLKAKVQVDRAAALAGDR